MGGRGKTFFSDNNSEKKLKKKSASSDKNLKVIDKYDLEEQKIVKPVYPQVDDMFSKQKYLTNQQKLRRGTITLLTS